MFPYPPTPTPFPPGEAHFQIPQNYSLWAGTDLAIQSWNWLRDGRVIIQVILLVVIVVMGLYILNRFMTDFSKEDAEE